MEIRNLDIAIGPEGTELPPGRGTATQGAAVYNMRGCASCHGPSLKEGPAPELVEREITQTTNHYPIRYWTYAVNIWDYINRAMPYDRPGLLTVDEVYALTAYLLYRNEIIKQNEVMDNTTLPKVVMPHRDMYVPHPSGWKPGTPWPSSVHKP
jgi:cytochrome c